MAPRRPSSSVRMYSYGINHTPSVQLNTLKNCSFSANHDQGDANTCWLFATVTMIRASIRSALRKFGIKSDYLEQENHHKIMRREIAMNVFPFGEDGAFPYVIIRAV